MACTASRAAALVRTASALRSCAVPMTRITGCASRWHMAATAAPALCTGRQWPAPGLRAYSQQPAESKIWDFESLQKLITDPKADVVVVDTREQAELEATGRIPGAINIPIKSAPDSFHIGEEEFEDKFGFPRPAKDQELVFYCKAGVRSRAAAGLARQSGWNKLGEYPGSWMDWESHGGKTQK